MDSLNGISIQSIEEMLFSKSIKKIIGLTWSPDETKYDIEHVKSRLDDLCTHVGYYYLYPEYRDYDSRTGLHYHGYIFIYDWFKFNKRQKNSFKAYVIKPEYIFKFGEAQKYPNAITASIACGFRGWVNYCTKECHMNDHKVLSNHPTNLFCKYV